MVPPDAYLKSMESQLSQEKKIILLAHLVNFLHNFEIKHWKHPKYVDSSDQARIK